MGRLIPASTIEKFAPLELAGLLLSAALHNIRIAPSEKEVCGLLSDSYSDTNTVRYRSFREA